MRFCLIKNNPCFYYYRIKSHPLAAVYESFHGATEAMAVGAGAVLIYHLGAPHFNYLIIIGGNLQIKNKQKKKKKKCHLESQTDELIILSDDLTGTYISFQIK